MKNFAVVLLTVAPVVQGQRRYMQAAHLLFAKHVSE